MTTLIIFKTIFTGYLTIIHRNGQIEYSRTYVRTFVGTYGYLTRVPPLDLLAVGSAGEGKGACAREFLVVVTQCLLLLAGLHHSNTVT